MSQAKLEQRSELVFFYDVKYANPNGDPMDANRPRVDEETGTCIVTDVRLKRTVRDYLFEYKGYNGEEDDKDIFIRDNGDKPFTGKERSKSYKDREEFTRKFIDVRLFGGVSAPGDAKKEEKKTFNFTGPVQFGMGKTLHPVKVNLIKGTGAFATKEGAEQKTFREEYNITYGLIGFHGVINEAAAKYTQTTQADIDELQEALWNGTKNLLTRSKKGHMPRLLVKIDYKEKGFFIGDLCELVKIIPQEGKKIEGLEDVTDYILDVTQLNTQLEKYQDKIAKVVVQHDERLVLTTSIFSIG